MKHRASGRFWECYEALPDVVQLQADRAFQRLEEDPRYPALHLKKVGRFWSARVGLHYRALAVETDDDLVWFWIGTHAQYDVLVNR